MQSAQQNNFTTGGGATVMEDPEGTFRDKITTVDEEGKRIFLRPRKPKGSYTSARTVLSWFLLAFLFAGPFLRIGGQPVLLLNVVERKFVILGQIFWPQDFFLFGLAMITLVVFIILFTVVYGRIFCGWVCPQTIFMEMVFRKIEYWLEGDAGAQRRLDRMPWNGTKLRKRGLKHLIFFAIAFLIANTFMAYIVGSEQTLAIITQPPTANLAGFIAVTAFSLAFYFVFARLREQVCTNICPYGRLQGVLLDRNSVVVAYDRFRGESRGRTRKGQDRAALGLGDCIDCHQCVDVCPTGIDIRNGTQLECINCTACIDVCNSIMAKVDKPKGLIRYASEAGLSSGKPWRPTGRHIFYSVVLVALLGVLGTLLMTRSDIESTLLRTPGMLYQKAPDGRLSNLYNYSMVNKTNEAMTISFVLESPANGTLKLASDVPELQAQGTAEGTMLLYFDRTQLSGSKTPVRVGVYANGEKIETLKTVFMGPFGAGVNAAQTP